MEERRSEQKILADPRRASKWGRTPRTTTQSAQAMWDQTPAGRSTSSSGERGVAESPAAPEIPFDLTEEEIEGLLPTEGYCVTRYGDSDTEVSAAEDASRELLQQVLLELDGDVPLGPHDAGMLERIIKGREVDPSDREAMRGIKALFLIKNGKAPERKVGRRQVARIARESPRAAFGAAFALLMDEALAEGGQERAFVMGALAKIISLAPAAAAEFCYESVLVAAFAAASKDALVKSAAHDILHSLAEGVPLPRIILSMKKELKADSPHMRKCLSKAIGALCGSVGMSRMKPFLAAMAQSANANARSLFFRSAYEASKKTGDCAAKDFDFILPHINEALRRGGALEGATAGYLLQLVESLAKAGWPQDPHAFLGLASAVFERMSTARKMLLRLMRAGSSLVHRLPHPEKAVYSQLLLKRLRPLLSRSALPGSAHEKTLVVLQHLLDAGADAHDLVAANLAKIVHGGDAGSEKRAALRRILLETARKRDIAEFLMEEVASCSNASEMAMDVLAELGPALGARRAPLLLSSLRRAAKKFHPGAIRRIPEVLAGVPGAPEFAGEMMAMARKHLDDKASGEGAAKLICKMSLFVEDRKILRTVGNAVCEELRSCAEVSPCMADALHAVYRKGAGAAMRPSHAELAYELVPWTRKAGPGGLASLFSLAAFLCEEFAGDVHASEWLLLAKEAVDCMEKYNAPLREAACALVAAVSRNACGVEVADMLASSFAGGGGTGRDSASRALAILAENCGLPLVLPFLLREYAQHSLAQKMAALKALGRSIERCAASGESCRACISLILPMAEHALGNKDPSLRRAGCLVARSVLRSLGGVREDVPVLVHLLNLVFPNIVDPSFEQTLLDLVAEFTPKLGAPTLAKYLVQGMYHPAQRVRDVYRRAYLRVLHRSPGAILHKAQELPLQMLFEK